MNVTFNTYQEFWNYCLAICPNRKTGCAETCEHRKKLKIPPHGKFYHRKFEGVIP